MRLVYVDEQLKRTSLHVAALLPLRFPARRETLQLKALKDFHTHAICHVCFITKQE